MRDQASIGPSAQIEVIHIGRGSWVARILVVLRDPATGTLAALTGCALAGAAYLKSDGGAFPEEVALACIESGASHCGFRTSEGEFRVDRSEIPAYSHLTSSRSFGESFGSAFGDGQYGGGNFGGDITADSTSNTSDSSRPISGEPHVFLTRTSGGYAVDPDGRRAELKDGSVVFGSRWVPFKNVRFIDPPPGSLVAGVANEGRSLANVAVTLTGQFERMASDNEIYFKTAGSVFRVKFVEGAISSAPLDQTVSVVAYLDPDNVGEIRVRSIAIDSK